MAIAGLPSIDALDATGIRLGIVTSLWNTEICDQLHHRAIATAQAAGAEVEEVRVVGALELPIVAAELAKHCDAVVVLGCVIRGGTPHFEYVCDAVTAGVTRVSLDAQKPVTNGVLTTNDVQQAQDRAGFADSAEDKGAEAVVAALHTLHTLSGLRHKGNTPA